MEGIQQESKGIELYRDLNRIQVPVLVIKGGTQESLLSEVETEKLKSNLPDVVTKELNESGHELWEPSKERFIQLINEFLVRLDDSS
ncbi:alpha/beta fold hydrolase [Sutcliffiella cohnii]